VKIERVSVSVCEPHLTFGAKDAPKRLGVFLGSLLIRVVGDIMAESLDDLVETLRVE
jgi:hypothetical protein